MNKIIIITVRILFTPFAIAFFLFGIIILSLSAELELEEIGDVIKDYYKGEPI